VAVVELIVAPFTVTDHEVPDGRPVSENARGYVVTVNTTATGVGANPFTVTLPEGGVAV
jgi:hypothetical protein